MRTADEVENALAVRACQKLTVRQVLGLNLLVVVDLPNYQISLIMVNLIVVGPRRSR